MYWDMRRQFMPMMSDGEGDGEELLLDLDGVADDVEDRLLGRAG